MSYFETVVKQAEEFKPELFKRLSPRAFIGQPNYYSTKFFSASVVNELIGIELLHSKHPGGEARADVLDALAEVFVPSLDVLSSYKMPWFFLGEDFLKAIALSNFRETLDWQSMKLPYESGLFAIPRNTVKTSEGVDVAFIMYTRTKKGYYASSFVSADINVEKDKFSILIGLSNGGWHIVHLSALYSKGIVLEGTEVGREFTVDARQFNEHLTWLVFGTLLAMTARPELIEPESCVQQFLNKRKNEPHELWKPNIIGARYRSNTVKKGGGSNITKLVRMHWRRGHFRNQACGIKWNDRQVIWLEPMLIAVEERETT